MDYRILGSLEVRDDDRVLGLGGDKPRALLAILLLNRNEVVSADRLIDGLWGESPPATALRTVQAHVSRVRKALDGNGGSSASAGDFLGASRDGVLVTRPHGYLLRVAPGELDVDRFAELTELGRDALAAGQCEKAASVLREALALWRGPPLADFLYQPFAQAAIARLEELHIAAIEERVEADLALGHARDLVGELRELVARHPLRERLRGQLMLALYRGGRDAEALEVYQDLRHALSEELGLDPGVGLQQLELAILGRDPSLEPAARPAGFDASAVSSQALVSDAQEPRRRTLAFAAALLAIALAIASVVVALSGGRSAPRMIPGDSVGAIAPSGGAIRAVVPLGASPSALSAGYGGIWVADENAGTVARIDPATRSVVQTIQVGSAPSAIAAGGGAVWVSNSYDGTVSRIDPTVNRVVQTIPVGNAPTGEAVGDGSVWIANSSDGTLSRIDAVTGAVRATIALGAGATDVAVGENAVWVSDEAGDRVLRVDPQTDQVSASINVGSGPTAIAVGFGSVWVANSLDGTVSRIDPATDSVEETIAVGDGAGAVARGGHSIWVASQYAGTVSQIDPATDSVARTIDVGNEPQGLAVARGLMWVGAQPTASRHRGGTLNLLSLGTVDSADPVLRTWAASAWAYDGLTAYRRVGGSASTQVVPDLTVSLPSPTDGGTTYTFQLRRGIRFSDGELVRPEDFRRALERDLIVGPSPIYGDPFADVVGGATCAGHPSHCDLSRGVVTDDATNSVTFHLVAPNPEFLARLALMDAVAVPAGAPVHDIGLHPLPATGPYMYASFTPRYVRMVRNPYFHEWSHAAQPDGYPDQIVFRSVANQSAALAAVEQGSADYAYQGVPPDRLSDLQMRFPSRLYVDPLIATDALVLNTRVAPFDDVRARQAVNYAIDRANVARLLGHDARPTCQILAPSLPGYERYCPYTIDPNPSGIWHAPDLAKAMRLIGASHTRGTPVTIWNLGAYQTDFTPIGPYLVSLLDRLGYPTTVKYLSNDNNAASRFADSRTKAQAALAEFTPQYLSASQIIQVGFSCQYFVPDSPGSSNLSEFCDHRLDSQINSALAAESNNSPDAAALWAQADRTATAQAPEVPLTNPSNIDFVSSRVGDYQYSFSAGQGIFADQLWVR